MNCVHYDLKVAHQCKERRAEPEHSKTAANFCEYFEMAKRNFKGALADPREDKARDTLRKLFGD